MNVHSAPEDYALEIVAQYDLLQESYEFDIRCVWRVIDGPRAGRLYTARDSGCSCPSPFEDYTSVESLERLTSMTALKEEYREAIKNGRSVDMQGWQKFKTAVEAVLNDVRRK